VGERGGQKSLPGLLECPAQSSWGSQHFAGPRCKSYMNYLIMVGMSDIHRLIRDVAMRYDKLSG